MKILILGGSGLLAGPVAYQLDKAGFGLRLFSRSVKADMFSKDFELMQGDLFNPADLEKACETCDAVHISVSGVDDEKAMEAILDTAGKAGIKKISLVSGATVAEENRWFSFTDKKYRAEQMLIQSGIPYYIFRPTWFFESLGMLVRNGKATILGHQVHPYHWVSADDLGSMVATAYATPGAENGIYYVYGPERADMRNMLERYCARFHPEISKISEAPIPLLRFIAFISGKKGLRFATSLFSYFEKVPEPEIPEKELAKLGRPATDFDTWARQK